MPLPLTDNLSQHPLKTRVWRQTKSSIRVQEREPFWSQQHTLVC